MASSTSVTFTYHYGSFKKEEEKVLAEFFDAMLYVANWGTKRLMFRFPKDLVDEEAVRQYAIGSKYEEIYLSFKKKGKYFILDINFSDDEGGGWIENSKK